MPKEWKIPKRNQPIWRVVRNFFKPFFKVKAVEYEGERLPEQCIILSNHNKKKGPMVYELNLPVFHATWGAYPMLGNFKDRFLYLRDVFYMQKNGVKKFKATIRAGFEAIFSPFIYKGMKILPSYPDGRFRQTLRYSIEVLKSGAAISLYSEDSSNGYFDELTSFHPGFVMLAQTYYKQTGVDLPVFPVYWGRKKNKIVVGKPLYVQKLANKGLNRYEIAEVFKKEVNRLYATYFKE